VAESPALYLASRSPRRAQLLSELGVRFAIVDAPVPEVPTPNQDPRVYALETAVAKAQAGRARLAGDCPVLGADTDVSIDGEILGKPLNRAQGVAMLRRLSARTHLVCSAVAIAAERRLETAVTVTEVDFAAISDRAAQAYWDSGEPADKAGGYAIQGFAARWVRALRGSYSGVIGLPLVETAELLERFGIVSQR
jgi:septum formation protein